MKQNPKTPRKTVVDESPITSRPGATGVSQPGRVAAILSLLGLTMLLGGAAQAQVLTNGANHDGTIVVSGTNTYTFSATTGETIVLRCGELTGSASFAPWLRLYGPTAALLVSDANASDAYLEFRATNSGTFTVTVNSTGSGQNGTYRLRFFKMPGAFIVPAGDDGGALTNGANHDGVTDIGDEDAWSFTANAKDSIILRCGRLSGAGANGYYPYIRLYGPTGALLDSDFQASDSYITYRATNSGTFTAIVGSAYRGDTGTYRLRFVQVPGTFVVPAGDEGGSLTNGANHDGVTALGDEDIWTFTANNKDSVILRCGELSGAGANGYHSFLRLYGPDGALLDSDFQATDSYIAYRTTNSGTFSVVVGSAYRGDTGTYRLRFMQIPGASIVSSGDEGGSLTNGANHNGVTAVGDEDLWTFTANTKDNIILRCGELTGAGPNLYYPYLRLYGPDGALLATGQDDNDSYIAYQTTNSGTFSIVVGSYYRGDTGSYRLRLAQIPGAFIVPSADQGGALTNGDNHDGATDLGDEDMWTFTANTKDSIVLRCGQLTGAGPNGYYPYLRLYGPNGALLATDTDDNDAHIAYQTTNSGTFTVLLGSYYAGDNGTYRLRFLKIPGAFIVPAGDDGGLLTNGANHDGTTDLGDEDIWTFTANTKDNIVLRCGQLSGAGPNGYYPHLRLYGPTGALLATDTDDNDAYIAYQTTNSGTFTVLVGSYYAGDNGTYRLGLAQVPGPFVVSPGDQGGSLTNAANHDGEITVGDEDLWRFTACTGDRIVLNCAELTGSGIFYPWIRLYGPDGAYLTQGLDNDLATLNYTTTNRGTFTVIVASYYRGETGTYRLTSNGLSDGFKLCNPVFAGTNATISGIGGPSNAVYVLTTTTNVSTPLAAWTPIRTNILDQYGTFVLTNAFNKADPERYFRLRQQ